MMEKKLNSDDDDDDYDHDDDDHEEDEQLVYLHSVSKATFEVMIPYLDYMSAGHTPSTIEPLSSTVTLESQTTPWEQEFIRSIPLDRDGSAQPLADLIRAANYVLLTSLQELATLALAASLKVARVSLDTGQHSHSAGDSLHGRQSGCILYEGRTKCTPNAAWCDGPGVYRR